MLLEAYSETSLPPTSRFVARERFAVGAKIAERTLSAIGFQFTDFFMQAVEENVRAETVKGWNLLYTASDRSLIDALGGEQRAVLPFLAYVYQLMELGTTGPAHVDGRSNFAFVRSPADNRVWAAHWNMNYAGEWVIGAVTVPHPGLDWRSGSRLFSR
jgi:hypothetical protein